MERTPVRSSDLAEIGYDEKSEILEILFRRGGIWQYHEIPVEVYNELMNAESHGSYFNFEIKDAYPCMYMGKDYWK